MAQQANVVVLGGNLTRDPELRSTPGGLSICKMRLANNRRRKSGDEWVDVPGYFDVTVFGKQADNCAEYLAKGRPVLVTGELRWHEWEADGGGKRQAVEVVANEVQFLSTGDREGGGRSSGGGGYQAPAEPGGDEGYRMETPAASAAEDDIPF